MRSIHASIHAWLTAGALALLCSGCIEESDPDETSVRETGYVACAVAEACDGALRCVTADDAERCVDLPAEPEGCDGDPCACWGASLCAADSVCTSAADGFSCAAPTQPDMRAPEPEAVPDMGRPDLDPPDQGISEPEPDPEAVELTEFRVTSTCRGDSPADQAELRGVLLSGERLLGPDDRVQGIDGALIDGLRAQLSFTAHPDESDAQPAVARGPEGAVLDIAPVIKGVRYTAQRSGDRLVILALDNSGSLVGEDPRNQEVDLDRASDLADERIAFMHLLTNLLPESAYLSVVGFQGEGATLSADPNDGVAPTRNRDITAMALDQLQFDSTGPTPLARALQQIRTSLVDANEELAPVVILFTDGVETGDPSDPDGEALANETARYAEQQIAVHVLQLRPPATTIYDRERDPALVRLACQTGGDHHFIESPREFTDVASRIGETIVSRLDGAWRVAVELPGMAEQAAGWWAVSTRLVISAASDVAADLQVSSDPERPWDDHRAWLQVD